MWFILSELNRGIKKGIHNGMPFLDIDFYLN